MWLEESFSLDIQSTCRFYSRPTVEPGMVAANKSWGTLVVEHVFAVDYLRAVVLRSWREG